jgi:voltage-gated potassium channel Kch
MQTYTVSLYWSVMTFTTIGYGDIVPFTNVERIFDIVAMLIGALVFGYIIGAVGNVVQQVRQTDAFCGE